MVGIEGVNGIVLGGHIKNIMHSSAGNRHVGDDQWLAENIPVHGITEQPAKIVDVDIGGRQQEFIRIGAGTRVVITMIETNATSPRYQLEKVIVE